MIDQSKLLQIVQAGKISSKDTDILYDVCDTVYSTHFKDRVEIKDDLIQEGMIGIIQLVDEGNYDSERGNVFSFLYARCRNRMTNYIYHNIDETRQELIDVPQEGVFSEIPEGKLFEINTFISKECKDLNISDEISRHIKIYFYDKLGITYPAHTPCDFSLDFVTKYKYYLNILLYKVHNKFLGGKVLDNNILDLIDVLEAEGVIGFEMRLFLDSLTKEQKKYMLYITESLFLEMPSKAQLLRVDEYLTIYNRIRRCNITVEQAARTYDKPIQTILAILQKYDIIFSHE